jgi:FtsH-binding integral membrane protein
MDYSQTSLQERLTDFMYKVYGLMGLAFVITGLTAYYIAKSPALYTPLVTRPGIFFAAIMVQLVLVVSISLLLPKLSFATASILFMLYAVSTGVTTSLVFLTYQMNSIYVAFLISAGMFFAMALYGYMTRADLSQIGSILLMALFGLMIGLFVNVFLQSSKFDIILSTVGVLIFAVLTAYDTQRIKYLGGIMLAEGQEVSKVAVFGALTLYLDFINLFLYILNLTGKRRD